MAEMNETDISGIVFTVSKGGGGSDFPKVALSEDEWYNTKLTEIKKVARPGSADGKIKAGEGLNWVFELTDPAYAVEVNGKKYQQRIFGKTSLIFSSNPERPSKLFLWYSKLTGKIPADGDKVTLSNLIGMDVAIMVKASPGKDGRMWFNVEKLKPAGAAKPAVAKPAAPAVAPKAEAPKVAEAVVTRPEDIPNDAVGTVAAPEGDLYKDVF